MSHYTLTRPSTPLADTTKLGGNNRAYFPHFVDMRDNAAWPSDWAIYTSTDHDTGDGGIYLLIGDGDPASPTNVKTYAEADADGDFDSFASHPSTAYIFRYTTEGNQTETPCVVKVGSTYYLTWHNFISGETQRTMIATSTDGLNFTAADISGGSAIILDESSVVHNGYMKWGLNPFSKIPYTYVGFGLANGPSGEGSTPFNGNAWWGTNDLSAKWDLIRKVSWRDGTAMGVEANRGGLTNGTLPIHKNSAGEWVQIVNGQTAGGGGGLKDVELYEVVLDDEAKPVREARKLLGVGSTFDNKELDRPHVFEWDGQTRVLYTGVDTNNNNELCIATATFDPGAELATPLRIGSSSIVDIDLKGLSSQPSTITVETNGSPSQTYTASGLVIDASSSTSNEVMVRSAEAFVPDDYGVIYFLLDVDLSSDGSVVFFGVTAESTGLHPPDESIRILSFGSIAPAFRYQSRNAAGSTVDEIETTLTTSSPIQGIGQGLQTCGLRWHVASNQVEFMQYDEDVPGRQLTLTANTVDTSKPYYLFAGLKGRAGTISGMRVRQTGEYVGGGGLLQRLHYGVGQRFGLLTG
ncbi:MAG: hypothetical protein AAGI37_17860 [Planctomycetota bacterium]